MSTTPTCEQTPSDLFLSLNGFEEIAIAKTFGSDVSEMKQTPMRFLRALAFVAERRGGAKDSEAYKTVMTLSTAQISDYFTEETEGDDLDADSPEGKDSTPSS